MKLRKISSLIALSAGIMLGGVNVNAESPYESLKGQLNKKIGSVEKSDLSILQKQKLNSIEKAFTGLESNEKKSSNYKANATTNDYPIVYEVEPNDDISIADSLGLDEIGVGILGHQYDIDTFQINVPQSGELGLIGTVDDYALTDLGFLLFDVNDNPIEFIDYYDDGLGGKIEIYNIPAGTYYIKAFSMNGYYGDAYGIMATLGTNDQDVTPPPAPKVDRVDDNDTFLTGTAEPNSIIEVSTNGSVVDTGVTGADGKFGVYFPQVYPVGTVFTVTATDQAGNTSAVTTVTVVSSVLNGWIIENGKTYHYTNGVVEKGWYKEGNKWFFLDKQTGEKKTGWVLDGKWYFLDSFGVMKTGWVYTGGKWYYLTSSGAMKTGWLFEGSKWYYLTQPGAMKTGWLFDGGKWYYLNSNGDMATGWKYVNGKWYYLYKSGAMAANTTIGGYKLGKDGAWIK